MLCLPIELQQLVIGDLDAPDAVGTIRYLMHDGEHELIRDARSRL